MAVSYSRSLRDDDVRSLPGEPRGCRLSCQPVAAAAECDPVSSASAAGLLRRRQPGRSLPHRVTIRRAPASAPLAPIAEYARRTARPNTGAGWRRSSSFACTQSPDLTSGHCLIDPNATGLAGATASQNRAVRTRWPAPGLAGVPGAAVTLDVQHARSRSARSRLGRVRAQRLAVCRAHADVSRRPARPCGPFVR